MAQQTLRTARLELRPLNWLHLDELVELDADPDVLRFIAPRARTPAEVEESVRRRLECATASGLGYWVGYIDEAFVGQWILRPLLDVDSVALPGVAELGYRLSRRWWRQGLAAEGARELLRHGFDDLALSTVVARTMAVNAGSRAVAATVGMTFARSYTEHFDEPVPGAEHGEVEYALTRPDWLRRARSE